MMSNPEKFEGVGYGKPPKGGQFKKGQSGNPSGKRKVPRVGDMIARQLAKMTTVTIEGKKVKMTQLELMTLQLVRKAASGDLPAIKVLLAEATLLDQEKGPEVPLMTTDQLEMLQQLVAAATALKED